MDLINNMWEVEEFNSQAEHMKKVHNGKDPKDYNYITGKGRIGKDLAKNISNQPFGLTEDEAAAMTGDELVIHAQNYAGDMGTAVNMLINAGIDKKRIVVFFV